MTVEELKDYLEDLPNDAEVMFAYQPNYPLFSAVSYRIAVDEENNQIYLAQSLSDQGYLSSEMSEELGWR